MLCHEKLKGCSMGQGGSCLLRSSSLLRLWCCILSKNCTKSKDSRVAAVAGNNCEACLLFRTTKNALTPVVLRM